ncbi:hypothetical protein [Mycobacterium intracellulare]|uniref:hypothetical protein n=1 Tax=Mycobacterium intracellulare TaxID=1767 RepID=UPI001EED748B|nr:hypothetical protein [Mycobacterium intracellulare]MEE3752989.1 hypothetical protein [Mycobacterium intracellulare]
MLTTWVEHLNAITDRLRTAGKTVTVLSGGMKARERRQIADQLANHTPDSDPLLIVGTSSFIGEGFDCRALDTLFLAAPITFKNRLVQYIGRVTLNYPRFSSDPYRRIGSYAPSVFAGVSAACVAVVGHCDGSLGSVGVRGHKVCRQQTRYFGGVGASVATQGPSRCW